MGYMNNKVRFKGMEVLVDRYNDRLSVRPVASALPRRYILNICLVNCRMTCFFQRKSISLSNIIIFRATRINRFSNQKTQLNWVK